MNYKKIVGLVGCVGALGCGGSMPGVAAPGLSAAPDAVIIGGGTATFGAHDLVGGFMPDPATYYGLSGGMMSVPSLLNVQGPVGNCRGHVAPNPDLIINYSSPAGFLRFFTRAQGDTTLLVHTPDGRWFCSDDEGGNLNAMLDVTGPSAGQYEVWIGSYSASEQINTTLGVTELVDVRP